MINTSNAYKEAIKKNREFSIHDVYTLSKSSVKIEMETGDFLAYSIDDLVELLLPRSTKRLWIIQMVNLMMWISGKQKLKQG